jgi:HEAT repeat protein
MRSVLRLFLLLLLTSCAVPQSQTANLPHTIQQTKLPEFVNDPQPGINEDLAAPLQKLIFENNYNAMKEILKHDAAVVREEMLKRLSSSQPMSLRLIAAGVLVLKNDENGRQFFIAQAKVPEDLGDLYVTLNHLVWSAEYLTGSKVDWSWAEDFMIEALQNRTRINLRAALNFPRNIRGEETIEVRELAVQYGFFSDHLVRMRSEKALPVILALLREYPFYGLDRCLSYIGRYKDGRVGPLLMDVLTKYRDSKRKDTYGSAVAAAAEMGLKAAVPILLRHLDDEESYAGLVALADSSVVPAIKAALPRLKSEPRAEAELAIIHLKGGDVLPPLLQLLKRTDYLKRDDVIMWLEDLKDPRSVSTMTSMLCYDPDWFVRSFSIRVLAAVRNKEAIAGLVNGLGCDYSKLTPPKTNPDDDFNGEYRGEIAKALQQITGENFGTDQKRWTSWLSQQH